jgi:microcystin-dependent protein
MNPYIGEIRMFGGNFAPIGWAFCNGQLLSIDEHDSLFTLIGTTYGGDGQTTFGLPNLQGRVPIHQGPGPGLSSYVLGEAAGREQVNLNLSHLPSHSHAFLANGAAGTAASPAGNVPAIATGNLYRPFAAPGVSLAPQSIGAVGGSLPHENLQPYLCISYIISLFGIFPTRT